MNENKRPQTQRSPRAQGHPQPAMPLPHQPRPTPLCTATAPDQKNRSKSNSAREEETPSRPLGGTRKSKPHERADEGRHRSKKLEQAENTEQTRETTHGRDQEQQPKKSGSESCTPQQNHSAGPGPFPKHPNCTLLWAGPGPDSYTQHARSAKQQQKRERKKTLAHSAVRGRAPRTRKRTREDTTQKPRQARGKRPDKGNSTGGPRGKSRRKAEGTEAAAAPSTHAPPAARVHTARPRCPGARPAACARTFDTHTFPSPLAPPPPPSHPTSKKAHPTTRGNSRDTRRENTHTQTHKQAEVHGAQTGRTHAHTKAPSRETGGQTGGGGGAARDGSPPGSKRARDRQTESDTGRVDDPGPRPDPPAAPRATTGTEPTGSPLERGLCARGGAGDRLTRRSLA